MQARRTINTPDGTAVRKRSYVAATTAIIGALACGVLASSQTHSWRSGRRENINIPHHTPAGGIGTALQRTVCRPGSHQENYLGIPDHGDSHRELALVTTAVRACQLVGVLPEAQIGDHRAGGLFHLRGRYPLHRETSHGIPHRRVSRVFTYRARMGSTDVRFCF